MNDISLNNKRLSAGITYWITGLEAFVLDDRPLSLATRVAYELTCDRGDSEGEQERT